MSRLNIVLSFDVMTDSSVNNILATIQDSLLHTYFIPEFKKIEARPVCANCGKQFCICNRNRNYKYINDVFRKNR